MGKRHRRRVWRSRERRCFAENREFKKIRLRNFTGIVRRDRAELIAAGWQEPAHCFSQATMVTRLGGRTLGRIDRANEALYIARYSDGGFLPAIKSFCASSGARRAWLTGNSCIMRGVGAATPLAWLQRRRWGWPVESYVIAEGEKGLDWVETLARYARDIRGKRRLITDFARYLAGMHDRDAAFRQLTGKDVIVVDKKPAFAFSIVDFGDVTIGSLPRRARIEQLYALARAGRESGVISKTDRLRFLRAYLGSDFHKEWKILGRGFRE
jgi:hypothetical protein